jgi:hypothetical protein
MMVIVEKLVEWGLAGETVVLGENLPSAILSTTNPTWPDPGSKPGHRGGKPATIIIIIIIIIICGVGLSP